MGCLATVQEKFLIPEDTILKVTDDHGVEVDEDVFPELAAKEICFVIYTNDGRAEKNYGTCILTQRQLSAECLLKC